jgi:hypothetical protein
MAKTNPKNVLEFFRKNYEKRLGGFTKSEPITHGQGDRVANVTDNYNGYKAPKPADLVSPAMKKGGSVKSKKSC